jgi:hypothetical protein
MNKNKYNLEKIQELITEALDHTQLDNMLLNNLWKKEIYDEYYGQEPNKKIRALVNYADRQGEMENLLQQIKNKNPFCFNNYRHEIKNLQPIEIKNFDLKNSVEESWNNIPSNGIFSLSFDCIHNSLIESFSERLKERIENNKSKGKVEKSRQIHVFRRLANPAHAIVKSINIEIRELNRCSTIIFKIVIDEYDPNVLLKSLRESLHNRDNLCLVIIFFGNIRYPSISNDLIIIDPKFTLKHLDEWIDNVTTALDTKQTTDKWTMISDRWKEIAGEYCDPHNTGNLNIDSVYEHLEDTKSAIQEDDAKILPKEFLEKLAPGEYAHV